MDEINIVLNNLNLNKEINETIELGYLYDLFKKPVSFGVGEYKIIVRNTIIRYKRYINNIMDWGDYRYIRDLIDKFFRESDLINKVNIMIKVDRILYETFVLEK